ncbi:MFS transporter [Chloroflexota bacterium]
MRINLPDKLSLNWVNRDGKLIILSRGLCTFARGAIVILIALYLEKLGFNLIQVGAFLSAGVAGSALFTFIVSLTSEKIGRKRLLIVLTLLYAATALALVFVDYFLPLMFFAFVGSIGDRGSLGPTHALEQASLSDTAPTEKRTDLFAVYRIVAMCGTALGTLAAGLPIIFQNTFPIREIDAFKVMFIGYAFFHVLGAMLYSLLSSSVEVGHSEQRWVNPLRLPSRRLIFKLTGLFSLDSFSGHMFLDSLAAYWFYTRFGLQLESLAAVFFLSYIIRAVSMWVAAKLANRIGLINTIVFTHIPSSLFLIAAAFAPTALIAVIFWQLRAFFINMDMPTRDSYSMSIVQPKERVAMASIHVVGRSVAGTIGPTLGTALWQVFAASVPLIASGILKISYDLSLYFMFRNIKPPQELDRTTGSKKIRK